MGKRLPMVIMERSQSDLSEDKVSPQTNDAPTKKDEPQSQPPSVIDENSSGKNEEQTGDSEEGYHSNIPAIRKFFQHEPITAQWFFNGVVALFTALTCWVTYWQYTAQLLDQRAWVAVESLVTHPSVPEVGQTFRISVNFVNSGKTPALNVLSRVVMDPLLKGKQPDFSYVDKPAARVGLMAPNGHTFVPFKTVRNRAGEEALLTPEVIEVLKNEDMRIYLHGHITYADIFKECHWIDFCYYLTAPNLSSFTVCLDHNDTDDEECKESPQ